MLGEVNGAGIWRMLSILRGRQRRNGKDQPPSSKEESHDRPRDSSSSSSSSYSSGCGVGSPPDPGGLSIRVATFNAAMFAMAPAVEARGEEEEGRCLGGASAAAAAATASSSKSKSTATAMEIDIRGKMANDRPRGILKQRSVHMKQQRSLRVSINLPDDEISSGGGRRGGTSGPLDGCDSGNSSGRFRTMAAAGAVGGGSGRLTSVGSIENQSSSSAAAADNKARGTMTTMKKRSVVEVLREVGADVVALQNVRAEEEKGMRPLSELAEGLGMPHYVFAESWAPDYGNAILSRWPIKRSWAQRIADDSDFRNVLKATIEVPRAGELNLHCTHLDHLDESWRMKQVEKILETNANGGGGGGGPHILAGGLNALDQDDYSAQRWAEIVKYYEDIGKPSPKPEVMRFLRQKRYVDARNFASELEQVVVAAKGQAVQGTCNYGTRVDYILASPHSPYHFVPGSYMVLSSTGTSDHHIVRVDVKIAATPAMNNNEGVGAAAAGSKGHNCSRARPPHQQPHWLLPRPAGGRHQQQPQHVVPVNNASTPSKGPWI